MQRLESETVSVQSGSSSSGVSSVNLVCIKAKEIWPRGERVRRAQGFH